MIKILGLANALLFYVCFSMVGMGWESVPAPEAWRAPAGSPRLVALLPASTLAAVEVRGLAGRWDEVRAAAPIARFQERVLEGSGLAPDDLPMLAGKRAVLALVPDEGGRRAIPVALLRPARPDWAAGRLEGAGLAVVRGRGALWVGPKADRKRLETLALGDGTSLARCLPLGEADRRLPAGGLARGWINPAAVRDLLRAQLPGTRPEGAEMMAALAAAELDVMRWAAFRRDLVPGGLVTEAVLAYDLEAMPPDVVGMLRENASPPPLPSRLPDPVVMAAAFRPEPRILDPWLRFVAAGDRRGPLRNLDFWMDEFEEWSGRDLALDLFGALGEHAWVFVLADEDGGRPGSVAILEARNARRAEETLLDLRSWLRDQAWGRTLGAALPRARDGLLDGEAVRGVTLQTPFGEVPGPVLMVTGGHLLVATGEPELREGLRLLETKGSWRVSEGPAPGHGSLVVRGSALDHLAEAVAGCDLLEGYGPLVGALPDLVGDFESVTGTMRYEGDALRLRGEIRFAVLAAD